MVEFTGIGEITTECLVCDGKGRVDLKIVGPMIQGRTQPPELVLEGDTYGAFSCPC